MRDSLQAVDCPDLQLEGTPHEVVDRVGLDIVSRRRELGDGVLRRVVDVPEGGIARRVRRARDADEIAVLVIEAEDRAREGSARRGDLRDRHIGGRTIGRPVRGGEDCADASARTCLTRRGAVEIDLVAERLLAGIGEIDRRAEDDETCVET